MIASSEDLSNTKDRAATVGPHINVNRSWSNAPVGAWVNAPSFVPLRFSSTWDNETKHLWNTENNIMGNSVLSMAEKYRMEFMLKIGNKHNHIGFALSLQKHSAQLKNNLRGQKQNTLLILLQLKDNIKHKNVIVPHPPKLKVNNGIKTSFSCP